MLKPATDTTSLNLPEANIAFLFISLSSALPPLPADAHSYAATGSLHPAHLQLATTIDFASRTLAGSATWQLAEPTVTAATLVLDTHGLPLDEVQLGTPAEALTAPYSLGPEAHPVLGQALRITVPTATRQVRINYRTTPNAAARQ